jgi:quinohemoprotein ethanol dehydrogenase
MNCVRCHGAQAIGAGVLPDLRKSGTYVRRNFFQIVAGGIPDSAMPQFGSFLKKDDIEAIRAYVDLRAEQSGMR